MLSLALLSYRGFWESGELGGDRLAGALRSGLDDLAPLRGDWELLWGPATYRHLGTLFDSSMMFVAASRRRAGHHAVVIRGTNPVSIADWVFGDFLPHRQVPWCAPGEGAAAPAVSLSAALGLKSLLLMRGATKLQGEIDPGSQVAFGDLAARMLSDLRGAGAAVLSRLEAVTQTRALDPALQGVSHLASALADYQQQWTKVMGVPLKVAEAVVNPPAMDDLLQLMNLRQTLVQRLDDAVGSLTDAPLAVLAPLGQESEEGDGAGGGCSLLSLLRQLSSVHGASLELSVTGHSKGGMLAPVLAMFLADTQGSPDGSLPDEYSWNRAGDALIDCYSFAGPTPGNGAFAARFNARLGRRFFRYANTRDATTLLWQCEQMRAMPSLLGEGAPGLPGMEIIAEQMANEVAHLEYVHPGRDYPAPGGVRDVFHKHVVEFRGRDPSADSPYPLEIIYQHLGAYIDFLGLDRFFDLPGLMGIGSSR
jgi:hypothetical protein